MVEPGEGHPVVEPGEPLGEAVSRPGSGVGWEGSRLRSLALAGSTTEGARSVVEPGEPLGEAVSRTGSGGGWGGVGSPRWGSLWASPCREPAGVRGGRVWTPLARAGWLDHRGGAFGGRAGRASGRG